jgi:hypothetical protein
LARAILSVRILTGLLPDYEFGRGHRIYVLAIADFGATGIAVTSPSE